MELTFREMKSQQATNGSTKSCPIEANAKGKNDSGQWLNVGRVSGRDPEEGMLDNKKKATMRLSMESRFVAVGIARPMCPES